MVHILDMVVDFQLSENNRELVFSMAIATPATSALMILMNVCHCRCAMIRFSEWFAAWMSAAVIHRITPSRHYHTFIDHQHPSQCTRNAHTHIHTSCMSKYDVPIVDILTKFWSFSMNIIRIIAAEKGCHLYDNKSSEKDGQTCDGSFPIGRSVAATSTYSIITKYILFEMYIFVGRTWLSSTSRMPPFPQNIAGIRII